jgi:Xaa-Pro aminopeptidase
MNSHTVRLASLREAMKENKIDVYIIPTGDPNLGEYISDYWQIIPWLTGFTGSAATVVVTDTFAGLWTDSRYYVQAHNQLRNSGFHFQKPVLHDKKDFTGWLSDNVNNVSTLGVDGRTISIAKMRRIERALEGKDIKYITDSDLITGLWNDRPALSDLPAFDFPVIYCGKDRSVKIAEMRDQMKRRKIDYHLLTELDDIMWLLNIRGNDVKYSPLLTSFAIAGEDQILLFADETKIPFKLASEFDRIGIVILPYEETGPILSSLPADASILLNPVTTSAGLYNSVPRGMKIIEDLSIPGKLKAVKNKVEIENIGRVMVKDGVALSKFFYWLEHRTVPVVITELSLAGKLNIFRLELAGYVGPSFPSIVAYNEHGALPHYSATIETDSVINDNGILLVDSGGQYLNGTTDITRTIALGSPSASQKKDFTLVLKGNINLAMAKVPAGTKGIQLDILARKPLWEQGLNYGHGTGHGVGFCLNVHEGPQSISSGDGAEPRTIIEAGMLISDEPGIYREGEYGIRIENLLICYEDEETEFGQFLRFDTVSLCYIDKSLIDISLLDQKEIDWLNNYHDTVYEKLNPYLNEDEKNWLKEKTEAIMGFGA